MRRYLILIAILLVPLVPLGLYVLGVFKPAVTAPQPVALRMWGVTEDVSAYKQIIEEYNRLRPYIRITYERIPSADYAAKLKDAWARGKGPDIFALPSNAIGEFANDFLAPLPNSTKVFTYFQKKFLFRTDVEIQPTTIPALTVPQLRREYVDVVADDVIRDNRIYGLPLVIDTLVLYYNRDLLRSANIVEPPTTWDQVRTIVPKLTIADEEGKILQSGIALGTGQNVSYASDIISLLFLQDGVTLASPDGSVRLDDSIGAESTNLGQNALSFYTSFADSSKATYSWNKDQPESRDAFMRGKTVMYVGYGSDRAEIESKSSVNFGIAPIPHLQPDGQDALLDPTGNILQANYGNYWVYSVFQRSPHQPEAWNFIQFMAKENRVGSFLAATKRVGALRSILAQQSTDPELGVFADQAISSRSWYHGRDATAVDGYLRTMIDNAASRKTTIPEALALARKQIELTTKKPF